MDNYKNMRTITSIRARVKIAVFYVMDIACLGATYFAGDYLQKYIQFAPKIYILFQITNLLVCLYMCLPSLNNPNRNNFSVLMLFLFRDKRHFLSNDFLFIKKKGKEQHHG